MPGGHSSSLVSVIISTYNRSDMLRLTVESVLAQTYPNIEIIVIDDGSTDDTSEVMAQYAECGQLKYIRLSTNQGGRGVREIGMQAASGQYINFLDHDDLFLTNKIERQVQVLEARPEIGLVHCGYYHIDENGNRTEKISFLPDGTLRELVCINQIWSGGPLIRRECLDRLEMNGDSWHGDWDLWLYLALAGYKFYCIQEPLGAYRILPGSQMSDVAMLERWAFTILDRLFADARLPAEVRAVKAQSYGTTHLWLSWRYYGAGQWEDARRNLTEAMTRLPHLLEQPEELLESLCGDALGVRINDPIKFVSDVLDHLPACAAALGQHRRGLLARTYVGLALRQYAFGHLEEAQRHIEEAIALNPTLLADPAEFAELLRHYANKLPVSAPSAYVETVLQNLPPGTQQLARVSSYVLSNVRVTCAFEDYYANRRNLVVPQILQALRYRPSWFKNRGVVSIFLRSLPALLNRKQFTA